jgi:hypothetical protein
MLPLKNIFRKGLVAGLALHLLFTGFGLRAQTFAEVDYVVKNKLYDFLIDYEKAVNKEGFSPSEIRGFYYNTGVEVYNDLSKDLPEYIPASLYLSTLDTMKAKSPKLGFYHYNLEMIKQQYGLYYDIVHIRLLKEIENDTLDERNIAISNVIKKDSLDYTLLFNKFEGEGVFKILKIEKQDESMNPSAWYKNSIPDEVRISMGPTFVNFSSPSNNNISINNNIGFDADVTVQNRFAGGKNVAVSWFAGLGATYISSEWSLQYDSTEMAGIDDYDDSYTRRVTSNNIGQDLSMLYLKVPLGIDVRLFNPTGFSLSFRGEIAPRYLLSSDYKTNSGNITYSGTYSETVGGENYPFYLSNLGNGDGSLYDFYNKTAGTNTGGVNFEKFGATLGFSVQASYKVGKHFDVFIAPSWRWGITPLLSSSSGDAYLSTSNWEANPIIEMEDNINFNTTSIEVGMIFRLNNIVKPFIKKTKFKDTERSEQRDNFKQYLVDKIPYNPPLYAEKERKKVSIYEKDKVYNYPSQTKYAYSQTTGIEKKTLKTGRSNKIKTDYKGLFLFKQFGYDIHPTSYTPEYNAYNEILVDSLNGDNIDLTMSYLPDLNVSIVMKMNEAERGVRDEIISNYRANMARKSDGLCALYIYDMHGSNIKEIFAESESKDFCFSCNDAQNSINKLEKTTQPGNEPVVDFINEMRILMKNEFTLKRRNINLDFYTGNSKAFITAFTQLQNLDKTNTLGSEVWFTDKDSEAEKAKLELLRNQIMANPVEVNQFKDITFYLDYSDDLQFEIKDLYYSPREQWQQNPFVRNTHKLLYQYIVSDEPDDEKKKSIRLRNFEFKRLEK